MLKIEILRMNEGDEIRLRINDEEKAFNYDTIDSLIDVFVNMAPNELDIVCPDDLELDNYKALLQNVFNEVQKDDFKNTYNSLKKSETSNDQIMGLFKNQNSK